MLFVVLSGGLLLLGALMRVPPRLSLFLIGCLWLAVTLAHLLLPEQSPLTRAFGGSIESWLAIGVVGLVAFGYRSLLSRLRRKAEKGAVSAAPANAAFSSTELDRYARHIILREIGGQGQKRLKQAKVLVVGAGGLGSPALLYLAAAGVGVIGVIDDDAVSNSNLQRQVLFRDADIGMPKVHAAAAALRALNPFVEVRPYAQRLTPEIAADLIAEYDLVLDGTDNFDTRYLVNSACVTAGKPLISAAISQWEGQISLFHSPGPCYACLFPAPPAEGLAPDCAQAGVMGALPGVLGAMMASEAIKFLTGAGQSLSGRLYVHDALWGESRTIAIKRADDCAVCAGRV
jgi:molybdopterin/thiamine biosynthesis adenylyltransferase